MKRALVTGGAGFLGSHIADALTDAGVATVIFDVRESSCLRPEQEMIEGDILDDDAVRRAVAGVDTIFHLAGLADLDKARSRPLEATRLNVEGTVRLLEAAADAGAERFMFASTVYVYSRAGGFYRCSKQACESYIEEFQRQRGLDYTILRYGSLYGPRADESNGVYRLLKAALLEGRIQHHGLPEDTRDYVHVEDAARLSVDAAGPDFANEHLVITGQQSMRIRDLFTMFGEILGRELAIEYADEADGLESYHYSVTPYAYSPKVGRKLTSNLSVDMGQGLIQLLDQIRHEDAVEERS